jgi:hypothetical protein
MIQKVLVLYSLTLLLSCSSSAEVCNSYKKDILSKSAEFHQVKAGDKIFEELMKCRDKKRGKEYIHKVMKCLQPFFKSRISYSELISYTMFLVTNKAFSKLGKCDYSTLEAHPSAVTGDDDFVLCSTFQKSKDEEKEKALLFFNYEGTKLVISDIKD